MFTEALASTWKSVNGGVSGVVASRFGSCVTWNAVGTSPPLDCIVWAVLAYILGFVSALLVVAFWGSSVALIFRRQTTEQDKAQGRRRAVPDEEEGGPPALPVQVRPQVPPLDLQQLAAELYTLANPRPVDKPVHPTPSKSTELTSEDFLHPGEIDLTSLLPSRSDSSGLHIRSA